MRWIVVVLAFAEAGFMVVDGVRALVRGDYFTPSAGDHAGQLGPWAGLVQRIGIDPRSTAMKLVFVLFGGTWLGITAAFALGAPWAWTAMLVFAIASLWYLVPGTIISAVIIALLFLPAVRGAFF